MGRIPHLESPPLNCFIFIWILLQLRTPGTDPEAARAGLVSQGQDMQVCPSSPAQTSSALSLLDHPISKGFSELEISWLCPQLRTTPCSQTRSGHAQPHLCSLRCPIPSGVTNPSPPAFTALPALGLAADGNLPPGVVPSAQPILSPSRTHL